MRKINANGIKMQELNNGVWVYLAGFFFTAWNGLQQATLNRLHTKQEVMQKELTETSKMLSKEREDHCIPRQECERTHKTLDDRLTKIETGITGINTRLDAVLNTGRKTER